MDFCPGLAILLRINFGGRTVSGKNHPDFVLPEDCNELLRNLEVKDTGVETIDLESLSQYTLTTSGSFDLTGVNTGFFAKLLQSIPIPAFLVDPGFNIIFANQACSNIDWGYKDILGNPFSSLFVDAFIGNEIQSVLEGDFSTKKYQVYADLQICDSRMWGRMTFRPLRMKEFRSVLVLVEDLSFLVGAHRVSITRAIKAIKESGKVIQEGRTLIVQPG